MKPFKYIFLTIVLAVCSLSLNALQREDSYSLKNNKFVLYQYDKNGVADTIIVAPASTTVCATFNAYEDYDLFSDILKNKMHNKASYLHYTSYKKADKPALYYIVTGEMEIELYALDKISDDDYKFLGYTKISFIEGEKDREIIFNTTDCSGRKTKSTFTKNSITEEKMPTITDIYLNGREIEYRRIHDPFFVFALYNADTYEFSALKKAYYLNTDANKHKISAMLPAVMTGLSMNPVKDANTLDFVSRTDPFVKEAIAAHKQYMPQLRERGYKWELVQSIKKDLNTGKYNENI